MGLVNIYVTGIVRRPNCGVSQEIKLGHEKYSIQF